ncbi:putative ribonuclease H-like domain-containing protein [Tanacetum coccineum]
MDVKSAFLYGTIEKEVYVCQSPGFEDPQFPNKVYKLEKALYGLHQAPRAWYETLSINLLENRYRRGTIDKTLFIKKDRDDVQEIPDEFYGGAHFLLMISSLVQQKEDGIFISQDKYVADILKKFDFTNVKAANTPIETNKVLNKDEEAEDVDVHLYRSMIGSLMYLKTSRPGIIFDVCACARFQVTPKTSHLHVVKRIFIYLKGQPKLDLWLISWQCKKQTIVANSTTEAEYVVDANCCGQVLWIQNQMLDYGFNFMNTKIHIDNESTICIMKNPMFHSKTKHIETRHHFIRDYYEKKLIQVIKIHTDHNVVDLLTKAFDVSRYRINNPIESHHTGSHQCSIPPHNHKTSSPSMQTTYVAEEAATMPHDSPLLGVHSLRSDEGSMTLNELTILCTILSKKVETLESDLKQTKLTYGAAYTKLIMKVKKLEHKVKSSKARRKVRLVVSKDEDELEDPSKQGRKISQIDEVSTAGAKVSTASPEVKTAAE